MDKDLKDSIKKIQKKRERYERLEKIVIFFTGVIAILIFLVIGLNVYSGLSEKVSEPEINIVENENVTKTPIVKKEEPKQKEEKIISTNKEKKVPEAKKPEKKTLKTETKKEKVAITTPPKLETPKEEILEPKKEQIKKTAFYTIQIGAFKTKVNAEKHIKKHNLENAFVIKEKNFYKVMVGKFKNKKEAILFMKKHKLKGFLRKIKG